MIFVREVRLSMARRELYDRVNTDQGCWDMSESFILKFR